MFMMLRQFRLRWLGHFRRMKVGRIPKYNLYEELVADKRNLGLTNYAIGMCARGHKAAEY